MENAKLNDVYLIKYGINSEKYFENSLSPFSLKEHLDALGKYISSAYYEQSTFGYGRDFSQSDNSTVYLKTGENTTISLYYYDDDGQFVYSREKQGNYIKVSLFGKILQLPKDCDIVALHKAVMMYDYALTELKKMKHSVALESPLYALKKSLEEDFRAIRDKKQTTITTDIEKYVKPEVFKGVYEKLDVENQKTIMIRAGKLPTENLFRKYPTTREEFDKVVEKVQPAFEAKRKEELERQELKEEKARKKEDAKRDKKQQKIAHKKKLTLEKQQHEKMVKDITEPNL